MESCDLEIKVLSASDLKELNTIGKMDPYVTVSLSSDPDSKQKTEVDTDGGKNPQWKGKPMKFLVTQEILKKQNVTLVFKIMAEKPFGDKEVGEVRVPIKDILEGADSGEQLGKTLRYSVTTPSGKTKGTLNFSRKILNNNVTKNICEPNVAGYGYGYGPPPMAAGPSYNFPPGHYPPPPQPQYGPAAGYYPPQQGYNPPQQDYYPPPQGYGYPGGAPPPGPYAYHAPPGPGYAPHPVPGYVQHTPVQKKKGKGKKGGLAGLAGLGAVAAIGAGLLGGAVLGDVGSDIVGAVGDFDYGAAYEDTIDTMNEGAYSASEAAYGYVDGYNPALDLI